MAVVVNLDFFLTEYKSAKVLQKEDANLWRPTISPVLSARGTKCQTGAAVTRQFKEKLRKTKISAKQIFIKSP